MRVSKQNYCKETMLTFPQIETTFMLAGPSGNLEVLATPLALNITPRPIIAIICHPHPLHGGTMHNKVVSTLARAFTNLHIASVRFNFRGTGKSNGVFADGIGEQQDLLSVIDWVKQTCPQHEIWLAGFSFGAAVSIHVANTLPVAKLISIAPPVPRFNLTDIKSITCPWIIVQGDLDDVVQPQDVYAWIATLNPQPKLICMEKAGHFFHGYLVELRTLLEQLVNH
jgi:uncharacterized protein